MLVVVGLVACAPQFTPPPGQPLPEAGSPIATLYVDRCGQCHGAPSPLAHTAIEWLPVVHRMQNRRAQKGMKLLTPDEFSTLVEYLQRHAPVAR